MAAPRSLSNRVLHTTSELSCPPISSSVGDRSITTSKEDPAADVARWLVVVHEDHGAGWLDARAGVARVSSQQTLRGGRRGSTVTKLARMIAAGLILEWATLSFATIVSW